MSLDGTLLDPSSELTLTCHRSYGQPAASGVTGTQPRRNAWIDWVVANVLMPKLSFGLTMRPFAFCWLSIHEIGDV